jgi:hypothetical protein
MGDYINLERWRRLVEYRRKVASGAYSMLNDYHKRAEERNLKGLAKQPPMTQEQFSAQFHRMNPNFQPKQKPSKETPGKNND